MTTLLRHVLYSVKAVLVAAVLCPDEKHLGISASIVAVQECTTDAWLVHY